MDLMRLLYRIMEELSRSGVPIIFKGAMVLNLIMHENNPTGIVRGTTDIDGDWYGEFPTMEKIEKQLSAAIKKVDPEITVCAVREFGEKKAAGFRLNNTLGEKVASIDLSIRENPYSQKYLSFVSNIEIIGASLEKVMADKLYAVSGDKVLRRIKDLLDIYMLSYVGTFEAAKIVGIWENTKRQPGDFSYIINNRTVIEEAYSRLHGVLNKPDFTVIYVRLIEAVDSLKGNGLMLF